jgi:type I restriction enzyme S subunit
MSKAWTEASLDEIASIVRKTVSPDSADSFYIGLEHIEKETLRLINYGHSSDVTSQKFAFQKNDILFGKLRPYFRKVILTKFSGVCSTDIWVIRAKEHVSQEFLFYLLSSWDFINVASCSNTGTRMPRADWNFLAGTKWMIPSFTEQTAIASVLSSLDDKIDLLHRQNQTLEAMAEALFRQWFVVEAKDDWVEGFIQDEFDLIMGQSPPGSSLNSSGIGISMFQGNSDFTFRFPKDRIFTVKPMRFAEKFDTLISVRAPVGALNMAKNKCCIGRGLAAFNYKFNKTYYSYTYFKIKTLVDIFKEYNNEGTVFGAITKADINLIKVTIPPLSEVTVIENKIKFLNDKIIYNCFHSTILEKIRDLLLPKLLNGELKIIN